MRTTEANSEADPAPRQCLICGGPTRYAHMEIDACRACAVFYRRLTLKRKPLVCRTGTLDCDTTKSEADSFFNPKSNYAGGNFCCKRCRFDRFTAVLNESRKPRNRQESYSSVEEPSTSTPNQLATSITAPECRVIESVRRGHSLMNAIRRTSELSTRTNTPDGQGISMDGMVIIPTTYTSLNQATRILISAIFEFASTAFEEFKSLEKDEQLLLVRNFYPFIAVLDAEYRAMKLMPEQKTMVLLSYSTYLDHSSISRFLSDSPTPEKNRDDAKRFVANHLRGDVQQMRKRMRRWSPTEEEYHAFVGICFWSLDKIIVSEEVQKIADKYRKLMFLELDGLYRQTMGIDQYASRMGEAVLFVEAIQSAYFEMRSKVGMLKLMDIIDDENLMAQLHLSRQAMPEAPLLLSVIHYSVCSIGILSNILLLLIIVTSTPQNMRSYAYILFTSSFIELITDVASFFLFMRIFPIDTSIVFTPFGFCSSLGSPNLCFFTYTLMFWGHSFYCIFLAFCFCYRLYIILYDLPSSQSVIVTIFIVLLPSTIVYVFFALSDLTGPDNLSILLSHAGLSDEAKDLHFAFNSVFDASVFAGLFWITAPFLPCYTVILYIGYRLIRILASESTHMSARTKRAHKEIVKGLIVQSCLPVVDCVSIGAYFFMELELTSFAPLGFATHMCGEIVISTNPMISLYFIRPYRERLANIFKRTKVVHVETTMSLSNEIRKGK